MDDVINRTGEQQHVLPAIAAPYTIYSRIPVFIADDGTVHSDLLWVIDLDEHSKYLTDLYLCCPVRRGGAAPSDWSAISTLRADRIMALAEDKGWGSVFRNLIPNFLAVSASLKKTKIAHGGLAGWAFPLDYYLLLLRPFRRFTWILNMESSFWLKQAGARASLRTTIAHHLHLFLGRACMRAADIRLFTQDWYRELMLGSDQRNSMVNEAVWVNERDVANKSDYDTRIARRDGPVRLLLPSRLLPDKGIGTVLQAVALLEKKWAGQDGPRLVVDVIGTGSMLDDIRTFIARHPSRAVSMTLLDPLPYGAPFFELLGRYDALIVANLKEEQPRIIFDGFSQGVPCIASRTTGVDQVAEEGKTGLLFTPGSAAELAAIMEEVAAGRARLSEMGARALETAQDSTHQAMHRKRAHFLFDEMGLR